MQDFSQNISALDTPLIYPRFSKVNEIPQAVEENIRLRDKQENMVSPQQLDLWKSYQRLTDADIEKRIHQNNVYNEADGR